MLVTESDPNRCASSWIPRMIPLILLRCIALSLFPSDFLKHFSTSWKPTPCVQQYIELHQLPSFSLCNIFLVILVLWTDSFLFRVLIYPRKMADSFVVLAMGESFVAKWLEYSVTWVSRFMLDPVSLVTAALPSNVSCARFVKDSSIPTRSLDP